MVFLAIDKSGLGMYVIGINKISTTVPENFKLYQNYPNPFNPSTKITFDIPANLKSNVSLVLYDINGKEVITLVNQNVQPGIYSADFDGSRIASGIYFYKLSIGNNNAELYTETRKVILIK